MENYVYWAEDNSEAITHYGTLGMKWGRRRYQYEDGSLTPEGRKRYLKGDGSLTRAGKKELDRRNKVLDYGQAVDFHKKYHGSKIYGEDIVKEGLSKEQYAKYKSSGSHDDWQDYAKYRELGIYNYAKAHYKNKISDLDDLTYKKYEGLWNEQTISAKMGIDPVTNTQIQHLKNIMSNTKIDDIKESEWVSSHSPYNLVTTDKNGKTVRTPIQANTAEEAVDAYIKLLNQNTNKSTTSKSSSSGAIKGISENDSRYGVMTKGLNGKDAQKYASLWSKMKTMEPGWSVDDFFLNVDEREKPELYKTMTEFEKLHNKAYHNVHG